MSLGISHIDSDDRDLEISRHVTGTHDVEARIDLASAPTSKTSLRKMAMIAMLFAASVASLLGCSRTSAIPGEVPVYPVKGQITLEGRPTPGAFVTFHPTSGEKTHAVLPSGWVDKDGKFSLTTYRASDGAPAGEYVVTVQWQQLVGVGDTARLGPSLVPRRYSNPQTSDLRFRVAQGATEPAALQLRR
jgi:hypothetical protein